MALIRCPDCSSDVSDRAESCPRCGYPIDHLTDFFTATKKNDLRMVEDLLKAGADVNRTDEKGFTPLMAAGYLGRTEIVRALLANGANVNLKRGNERTALMDASYFGSIEIVQTLLEAGADPEAVSLAGETALKIAAKRKKRDVERLLRNALISHTSTHREEAPPEPKEAVEVAAPQAVSESTERIKCTECGGETSVSDILCPNCNSLLVKRYCGHCSKLIPADADICPFCGDSGTSQSSFRGLPVRGLIAIVAIAIFALIIIWALRPTQDSANRLPKSVQTPQERASSNAVKRVPPVLEGTKQNPPASEAVGSNPQPQLEPEVKPEPPAQQIEEAPRANDETALRSQSARARIQEGHRLNNEGYRLIREGRYRDAVGVLRRSVQAFPPGTQDIFYGYALFNLAHSLRLSGRPDLAVPLLEQRMKLNNQRALVAQELKIARKEAAQMQD